MIGAFTYGGLTLYHGDALAVLRELPAESAHCCVTSPPYWGLRDYGVNGQIGLEGTPEEYVDRLVEIFREVRRVLRDDGTLWLNLGDSYANTSAGAGGLGKQWSNHGTVQMRGIMKDIPRGLKPKDLVGVPWRVAFALQADGWYLRSDIIWAKPNPMPESVTDRPTKAHEYLFLLAKSDQYYYDADAITEVAITEVNAPFAGRQGTSEYHARSGGIGTNGVRNRRSVWTVATRPFPDAHFATFPPKLIEPCILAGSPVDGVVLDPFAGAATTLVTAYQHGRRAIGIELSRDYCDMGARRIRRECAQTRIEWMSPSQYQKDDQKRADAERRR